MAPPHPNKSPSRIDKEKRKTKRQNEEKVTEDLKLIPISVYNKTKMVAERIFYSYSSDMNIHCIRPATVCGFSPRMRLDVSVNMLTFQALKNNLITVFGGNQTRPIST